jgi:hypothetical protein
MQTPRSVDTPERQKAAQIKKNLDAQTQALKAQNNLSREGRAAKMAEVRVRAEAKLAELRQVEQKRLIDRKEELHRKLFGNRNVDDARIASIRNARDRAADLDGDIDKVRELMTRADRDGDHVLLKAYAEEVARRAANPMARQQGWTELFHEWASNQVSGSEVIDELNAITFELTDLGQRMVRESAFSAGVLPEELHGYGNLHALAAEADQIPELPPSRAEEVGNHLKQFVFDDVR